VLITGDFFVTPPRIVYDLEGSLRGVYLDDVESTINCFFKRAETEVLSVGREDFNHSVQAAIAGKNMAGPAAPARG
jgi:lipoate-protein ligase A